MARVRAHPLVGKRSGVTLDNLPEPENHGNRHLQEGDFNAVFASAAARRTQPTKNIEKTSKNQPPPLRQTRFSLDGQQQNSSSTSELNLKSKDASSSHMVRKIMKYPGSVEEADLSPVSTASPTEQKHEITNLSVAHEEEEKKEEVEDIGDTTEERKETAKPSPEAQSSLPATPDEEPSDEALPPPKQDTMKSYTPEHHDEEDDYLPLDQDENDVAEEDGDGIQRSVNEDLIPPPPPDSDDEGGDIGIVKTPESVPSEKEESPEKTETPASENGPQLGQDEEDEEEERVDDNGLPSPEQQEVESTKKKSKKNGTAVKKKKSVHEKKKKKTDVRRKKRPVAVNEDDDSDSVAMTKARAKKKRKASRLTTTFSPKGIPLPREYKTIPVSDLKETPPRGVRRSGRARCQPLEYWKNEKAEYGPPGEGEAISSELFNMPVIKAYVRSKDTPYKPRKIPQVTRTHTNKAKKSKQNGGNATGDAVDSDQIVFDSTKLKKKYKYCESDEAVLWDDGIEETKDQKVVSFLENMESRKLPLSKSRSKSEGKVVGKAAQAFNVPNGPKATYVGYICGNLTLPPKGIKDAESVGACSQVFTVVRCQPGAMEVAYSDPEDDNDDDTFNPSTAQRFLLNPGDLFRVPPGNSYRLCNHSKTTDVFLTWIIVRPAALAPPQAHGDDTSNATPR